MANAERAAIVEMVKNSPSLEKEISNRERVLRDALSRYAYETLGEDRAIALEMISESWWMVNAY